MTSMKNALALPFLLACAPSIEADWEGKCDYGADEIQVELELSQDEEDVTGSGSLHFLVGNVLESVSVSVDGERDADERHRDAACGRARGVRALRVGERARAGRWLAGSAGALGYPYGCGGVGAVL